ncbi:MAG TPA: hypothetical protein VME20_13335 [Acidimicrobiales bacterium]|nr:hypothetical protein [Acidimicrobiales bacterium]
MAIREPLVLPAAGNELLVIGGQVPNGTSGSGGFLLNTSTGSLHLAVNLAGSAGVYDAAGASLGNQDYVFGGNGARVSSSVQSFPEPGGPVIPPAHDQSPSGSHASTKSSAARNSSANNVPAKKTPGSNSGSTGPSSAASPTTTALNAVSANTTSALPEPRAGAVAVGIGATVYIVGGYNGTSPIGAVLSTPDGGTFTTIATLPVPVRDAAVTAVGGEIYVFGGSHLAPATPVRASGASATSHATSPGQTAAPGTATKPKTGVSTATSAGRAAGPLVWSPVPYVQKVDPVTGKATIIGRLPVPLQGAVAVNLAGRVYVAGGRGPAGVNATIWGFEPATATLTREGQLAQGVYGAGVATLGTTAWLVGGVSRVGQLVGTVQNFQLK